MSHGLFLGFQWRLLQNKSVARVVSVPGQRRHNVVLTNAVRCALDVEVQSKTEKVLVVDRNQVLVHHRSIEIVAVGADLYGTMVGKNRGFSTSAVRAVMYGITKEGRML